MKPDDFKALRVQAEASVEGATDEEMRRQERNLLLSVFDAWPEIVQGICAGINEMFKQQVVIAQALDAAPLKVKAVRPDTLRAAVEAEGMEAIIDIISRVETNNVEILRRAKAVCAERDRIAASNASNASNASSASSAASTGGPGDGKAE